MKPCIHVTSSDSGSTEYQDGGHKPEVVITARISDNKVIQNLKLGSLSRQHFFVAVMGNIFSTIKGNMASKPEYTYNFALQRETAFQRRNGVTKQDAYT